MRTRVGHIVYIDCAAARACLSLCLFLPLSLSPGTLVLASLWPCANESEWKCVHKIGFLYIKFAGIRGGEERDVDSQKSYSINNPRTNVVVKLIWKFTFHRFSQSSSSSWMWMQFGTRERNSFGYYLMRRYLPWIQSNDSAFKPICVQILHILCMRFKKFVFFARIITFSLILNGIYCVFGHIVFFSTALPHNQLSHTHQIQENCVVATKTQMRFRIRARK